MCGIAGAIGWSADVERMTAALAPRGPDGQAVRSFMGGRVRLGHRRLAIVDLSDAGSQPMCNESADIWLTFNGEIYNHPDLRRELERRGHRYASDCDAESILHAYEEWGESFVKRLRGIFAFAIWDERRGRLIAARDHIGVKPFYYAESAGELLFGSQPRALLAGMTARVEPQSIVDYLSHGIVPAERAAFAGMRKLPPAHTLVWEDGCVSVGRYWQVQYKPTITDFNEAVELVAAGVEDAVRSQLMADVPIATYLSGGIDSSLLTGIANGFSAEQMHSFTVGFEESASDERRFAELVANHFGTQHHVDVLRHEAAMRLIDTVVEAHDEPFGMGAALPMTFISQLTQRHGFKVVLSGDGADELFAGYLHYDLLYGRYRKWGLRTANEVRSWARFLPVRGWFGRFDPLQYYAPHEAMMPPSLQKSILHPEFVAANRPQYDWRLPRHLDRNLPAVTAAQLLDLHTYLPDEILVKVDRATMAHGIEARVPFLDPKLVELAFSIDGTLHYRNGERKAVLKAAARRWLPESVLTTRKKGFSIPVDKWILRGGMGAQMTGEIADGWLVAHAILRQDGLSDAIEKLPANFVLQLYLLERWARRWVS